jgi:hypothetical protein
MKAWRKVMLNFLKNQRMKCRILGGYSHENVEEKSRRNDQKSEESS